MPQCSTVPFDHEILVNNMHQTLAQNHVPYQITNDLWGVMHLHNAYYWMGDVHAPAVIVKTHAIPHGRILNGLSKPAHGRGQPPYALDLFIQIFTHLDLNFLISDSNISKSTLAVWQRLATQPAGVHIVNFEKPLEAGRVVHTPHELEAFWTEDEQMRNYRFALFKPGITLSKIVLGQV